MTDDFPEPIKSPVLLWMMMVVYVAVTAVWVWHAYASGQDMTAFADGVMCGLLVSFYAFTLFIVWWKSR